MPDQNAADPPQEGPKEPKEDTEDEVAPPPDTDPPKDEETERILELRRNHKGPILSQSPPVHLVPYEDKKAGVQRPFGGYEYDPSIPESSEQEDTRPHMWAWFHGNKQMTSKHYPYCAESTLPEPHIQSSLIEGASKLLGGMKFIVNEWFEFL